jgi:hypothetical protein
MYFMAITIRGEAIGAAITATKMVRVSRGFMEVKEPLPPHIETLGEEDKATFSSYKRIPTGNTGANIVVYNPDKN